MTANQIRKKYIEFFTDKIRKHKEIPPAPLVPPGDPTTLFTGSGMQQLAPFLKGEPHPMGTRIVDSQPCFRAEDIEEVGDNRHTTFFEMLGNWSLGDYFKSDQLTWFFEFLTDKNEGVGLDPKKLFVTVFEGNKQVPKDKESISIWQDLFKTKEPVQPGEKDFDPKVKIYSYDATKNWWSRVGVPENMPPGEIGGPDSETFYDFGEKLNIHEKSKYKARPCHVNCDCGRFLEIGNSVFMEYEKQKDGSFKPLPKQNVDFGGGLERIVAANQNKQDIFLTDLFKPLINEIQNVTGAEYKGKNKKRMRIIADHIKASVFIAREGIKPSNKLQGSVLRRLLRQAIFQLRQIQKNTNEQDIVEISKKVIEIYKDNYFSKSINTSDIEKTIGAEVFKFTLALDKGLPKYINKYNKLDFDKDPEKIIEEELKPHELTTDEFIVSTTPTSLPSAAVGLTTASGTATYGLPLEYTLPEIKKLNWVENLDEEDVIKANKIGTKLHQNLSRKKSVGMFKGGLADQKETTTKLHTATHLLHTALREILGDHVCQEGSNITAKRLRFDFKHDKALTDEEIKKVENIINQQIKENLPVHKTIEDKDKALKTGTLAFFRETYPEKVLVYTIGKDSKKNWFSKELCGGPHVKSTGEIGTIKITKQKSIGAGLRRIYAELVK